MRRLCYLSLSVLFLSIYFTFSCYAQEWVSSYRASGIESVHNASDEGYILAIGMSGSLRVMKIDDNGEPIWRKFLFKSITGSHYSTNWFSSVSTSLQPTDDGGYIVTTPIHQQPDGTYGAGQRDVWVLKLDNNGDIEWQRTYGGAYNDGPCDIKQTSDGGYVVAGRTNLGLYSPSSSWVMKLSSNGAITWQRAYGGYAAKSIQQTSDNGYIVACINSDAGAGDDDFWVLKLDSSGNIETDGQLTFGGPDDDTVYVIKQTSDGGYIVGGETRSFNIQPGTSASIWLLKLDGSLDVEWQNTYSGNTLLPDTWIDRNIPYDIAESSDGNFIIAGTTGHFGSGAADAWIFKVSETDGSILWENSYGGPDDYDSIDTRVEDFYSITEDNDGNIIAGGRSLNFPGWVLKLDEFGEVSDDCSIMSGTTAIVTITSVSGQDTAAAPQDTTAIVGYPPGVAQSYTSTRDLICPAGIDLSVSITDTPDPVRPNNYYAYVLTAFNQGGDDAIDVTLTADLPSGVTFFSVTSTKGTTSESGGQVTADIGDLASGESVLVTTVVQAGNAGDYTLDASITGTGVEINNSNDAGSETTHVSQWLGVTVDSMDWMSPSMAIDSKGFSHFGYTRGEDLRYATNAFGDWMHWTLVEVDSDYISGVAIAIDDSDNIHIAYGQDSELKYLNNISGVWSSFQAIRENSVTPSSISMDIASDNSVHICFLTEAMNPMADLIYVTNQGGSWDTLTLHTDAYSFSSLALDPNDNIHISFYSYQIISGDYTTSGAGYITNAPDGTWQSPEPIEVDWSGGQMEGMVTGISVDSGNTPYIVYVGDSDEEGNEDIMYASRATGSWVVEEVDDGDYGSAGQAIALDSNGDVFISYFHMPTNEFRIADNNTSSWSYSTITDNGGGWFNVIAVDRFGQVHIGYYDGNLKYAVHLTRPDSDGDGVSDEEEDGAPNSGDANSDSTLDSLQSNITSLLTSNNTDYVTLVSPSDTVLTQVRALPNPSPDDTPDNSSFYFDFFSFTQFGVEAGQSITVDMVLLDSSSNTYFKYGPTPQDTTDHWYHFFYDGETGVSATDNILTLTLLDGQRGDSDLTANGIISDPGGPANGPVGVQQISVTPALLDFGDVEIGTDLDLILTVQNIGSEDLTISGVTVSGELFTVFDDPCTGDILMPANECDIILRYTPVALSTTRETLTIFSDDPMFPEKTVNLLGTGIPSPEPDIVVEPLSIDFGNVDIGDSSENILSITNLGVGNLHIDSISLASSSFNIINDFASGAVLHTGDKTSLIVQFEPTVAGAVENTFNISSDDPDTPSMTVSLAGTGIATGGTPVLDLSLTSIDFGESGTTTYFDVSNIGTGTLTWNISPAMPAWLTASPMNGNTNEGESTTVTLTVDRDQIVDEGNHNYELIISSNDGMGNIFVEVDKVSAPDEPVLSINPTSLGFGDSSTQETFVIENSGVSNLNWTISPALPDWLDVSPTSGDNSSGVTVTITVNVDRDQAQGSGVHNTSIMISSNGGDESVFVEMTKLNLFNPIALASFSPDNAPAGDAVQLSGVNSYDPDGDTIVSYQWAWEVGSGVTNPSYYGAYISDEQSVNPIFTAIVAGEYDISLVVSDGERSSVTDIVTITLIENTEPNNPPEADAGGDQNVVVDNNLTLDGTGSSDPDGSPITAYEWQFVWDEENGTAPIALGASLTDYDTAYPVFSCTRPGQFELSLVVMDSRGAQSDPDLITITVQDIGLDHSDTDGIRDTDELGPDGNDPDYDGNGDLIPDQGQNNVASLPDHQGDDYITIASPEDTFLSGVTTSNAFSVGGGPPGYNFPMQFFSFTIHNVGLGGSTTVTIFLPDEYETDTYYKYGPTPGNPADHWYEFMYDGETGAVLSGNVITLYFVDGKRGDDILVEDGQIIDLGGPGFIGTGGPSETGTAGGCFISTTVQPLLNKDR